jgi:hypothetical protein
MDARGSEPPTEKKLEVHLLLGLCIRLHYRQGSYI